jgi:hypothetical protein
MEDQAAELPTKARPPRRDKPAIYGFVFVDDKPLPAVQILLANVDSSAESAAPRIARTGEDGRFSFRGIPKGHYRLHFPREHGAPDSDAPYELITDPLVDVEFGGTDAWLAPSFFGRPRWSKHHPLGQLEQRVFEIERNAAETKSTIGDLQGRVDDHDDRLGILESQVVVVDDGSTVDRASAVNEIHQADVFWQTVTGLLDNFGGWLAPIVNPPTSRRNPLLPPPAGQLRDGVALVEIQSQINALTSLAHSEQLWTASQAAYVAIAPENDIARAADEVIRRTKLRADAVTTQISALATMAAAIPKHHSAAAVRELAERLNQLEADIRGQFALYEERRPS